MNRLAEHGALALGFAAFALLPFGRTSELPIALAAAFGLYAIARGRIDWRAPGPRLTLALFLGYWLPQLLSAPDAIAPSRTWSEVAGDLRYLPGLLWLQQRLADARRLASLQTGIAIVLGVWLLDASVQAGTGWSLGGPSSPDRLSGIFGADNLKLGAMLAVLSPFLLLAAFRRSRWLGASGLILLLLIVLLAGTRSAWITLAVVLAALAINAWGCRRALLASGGVMVLAVALGSVAHLSSPRFAERIHRSAAALQGDAVAIDYALSFRLPIWQTATAMIAAHPLNGVGVRGFRVAYPDFAAADDRWRDFDGRHGALHPHQWLLEVLSETGLVGLGCWLAALGCAARAWRNATEHARAAARPAGIALLAMLFPLNTHYAFYASEWGGLLMLLLAVWLAALNRPAASPPAAV